MKPSGLSQQEIDALFASATAEPQPATAPSPQPALFPNLEPSQPAPQADPAAIGILANVEMEVSVHLGQTRRSIRDILSMGEGSVVELDRLAGESVDILVNNRLVARGEIVVIGENFGVRVTELLGTAAGGKAK